MSDLPAWDGKSTLSRKEMRDHVAWTLNVYVKEDGWVGGCADLGAADAVIEQIEWWVDNHRGR